MVDYYRIQGLSVDGSVCFECSRGDVDEAISEALAVCDNPHIDCDVVRILTPDEEVIWSQ